METDLRNRLGQIINPYLVSLLIVIFFFTKIDAYKDYRWGKPITSDVNYYYGYLPAHFIYDDLTLKFRDTASKEVVEHLYYLKLENGNGLIKTTMGVAYFLAPAFLVANSLAEKYGFEANGYTQPYHLSILITALIVSALSLLVLVPLLRLFFRDWIVSLLLIILFIGTNLFIYVTTEPGMSHLYSFFLVASFMLLSIRWLAKPSLMHSVLLGIATGWMVLVRPINILVILFFLLYDVKNVQDLKARFIVLFSKPLALLTIILFAIVTWIPQFLYWKHVTGYYFYFSYAPEEQFFFTDPEILKGLFSYRKGWLLYTPVMAVALFGFVVLIKRKRELFLSTLPLILIYIYVVFSWWCWWYGGSFGQRAMIDVYAILAIPLGCFIQAFDTTWIKRTVVFVLLAGFIYLNQLQSAQYRSGAIHWDSMSKEAYWGVFGKVQPPENFEKLIDPPDYKAAERGEPE